MNKSYSYPAINLAKIRVCYSTKPGLITMSQSNLQQAGMKNNFILYFPGSSVSNINTPCSVGNDIHDDEIVNDGIGDKEKAGFASFNII